MKNILIILAFLCAGSLSAQTIVRTVGITYTQGAPTHTPSAAGSEIVYDITNKDYYEYTGSGWNKVGEVVDFISGGAAPNYTPGTFDSRLAINANAELYFYNTSTSAWVPVGGAGVTDLTFTGSASPFTLNSSTGTNVTFAQNGIVTLTRNINELTISATEADGDPTNELQTLSHASDATSHTVTLSNTGGSLKLIEGAAIGLTTANVSEVTISIPNDAVTFGKMQEISGQHLVGRHAGGSGDIQEVSVGNGIEFQGSGIRRSALAGDVTATAGSNTTTIANGAVSYAKMQNVSAASRLLGRGSAGGAGDPQELTVTSPLTISGTAVELGTVGVANGGTGQTTYTNGQLLIGNTTGNTLAKATLTAGYHMNVTNGAGSITLATAIDTMCMVIACSDETSDLTTGTAKVTFRAPFKMKVTAVRLNVNTSPAGASVIVNIKEAGNTLFSVKPQVDAGQLTSTSAPTFSDTDLADNAEMTIDIDQVGSSTAGKGLKVHIYYIKQY
jgi:hypothetical protein